MSGLDLGIRNDRAAFVILAVSENDNAIHLAHAKSWNPLDYGGEIPLRIVEKHIRECRERFDCHYVRYDGYQAIQMAQNLAGDGFYMQEFTPSPKNLDVATTTLIGAISNQTVTFYREQKLMEDFAKLNIQQRATGLFKLVAPRDASGHCDLATAFYQVLPAAIQLQNELFAGDEPEQIITV